MLDAYIECAFWSSNDESTPEGGEPMDASYSASDLAPEALAKMTKDVCEFLIANRDDIDGRYEQAGHDLWLTRNRHGAGFWEAPDWERAAGERLTAAARALGECYLVVGDDGQIHCEGGR